MVNNEQRSRQQLQKATNLQATDYKKRDADVLLQTGNWSALSFDCCVVPPEELVSYAQELDEIVDALLPMFVGQDRLDVSI